MGTPKLSINGLMTAVMDYKLTDIKNSLRLYGLPKNGPKINDYMILQRALTHRQKEIAILLIEAGCRVQTKNSDTGWSPLALAINMQNKGLVGLLIHKKATLAAGNGSSVLHLAAQRNNIEMIELLLQYKIDINYQDSSGKTPLQALLEEVSISRSISEQRLQNESKNKTIKFLMSKGATVNFTSINRDKILSEVMKLNSEEVLFLCLDKLENINDCNQNNDTVLNILLSNTINNEDESLKIVKILIEKGVSVDSFNKNHQTALHIAAKNKYYKILETLLECQCNVNISNYQKDTVLHIILRNILGSKKSVDQEKHCIEILLSKGAKVDIPNLRKATALTIAFDLRQKNIWELILEHVEDLNSCKIYDEFVLHYVTQLKSDTEKRIFVIEDFLRRGAWIDIPNELKQTPLHVACINRQKEMIEILLRNGANVNSKDICGRTILRSVVEKNENTLLTQEIAEVLLASGAVVEDDKCGEISLLQYTSKNDFRPMLILLLKYCKRVDYRNIHEDTILHNLVKPNRNIDDDEETERANIAEVMLSKGVEIEARNKQGITALHLAAQNKHDKVIQVLVAHNAMAADFDEGGNNLLHSLSMKKCIAPKNIENEMVQKFISYGCDVNATNDIGKTPLLIAIETGCARVVTALMRHGANIHYPQEDTLETPLHLAVKFNRVSFVELFLNFGVCIDALNKNKRTPLHYAAKNNSSDVVKILLDHGADIRIQDSHLMTPLHIACLRNNLSSVNYLLVYGADINVTDKNGVTPVALAFYRETIRKKMLEYAIKLDAVKSTNRSAEYFTSTNNGQHVLPSSIEKIIRELSEMDKISLDSKMTLANTLLMDDNQLSIYKNNIVFRDVLKSNDFNRKFSQYGEMLKACYHRGMVRSKFFSEAQYVLRSIIKLPIPDVCTENIVKRLSNGNLHCLIKAFKMSKKRRSLGKFECDVPLKMVRGSF